MSHRLHRDSVMAYERSIVCHHLHVRPNTQTSGHSVVQAVEVAQSERGKGVQGLKWEAERAALR
jgi:hypothetical protein